jgi:hypothetical protein
LKAFRPPSTSFFLFAVALTLAACTAPAPPAPTPVAPARTATPAPVGTPAVSDVPLHPGFRWTPARPFTESVALVGLPARQWESAHNPSANGAEVALYYRRELARLGFLVGPEAGSETSFGIVAARQGAALQINFWQGEQPGPQPVRPELGYKLRIIGGTDTPAAWTLAGLADAGATAFGQLPPPAEQAPPPAGLFQTYALAGGPRDLPASAPVYKTRQPDFAPTGARSLAGAFGYRGDPRREGERTSPAGTGPFVTYTWSEGGGQLQVFPIAGGFLATEPPSPPDAPADATAALAWLRAYLRERGLLYPDLTAEAVRPVAGGFAAQFGRELEGRPVLGAWTSGVAVTYQAEGRPTWAFHGVHRPLEARSVYPLRPVDAAWAEVAAGRALLVDGVADSRSALTQLGRFSADSIDLVYREVGVDTHQPFLEPLYAFRGKAEGSGEQEIILYAPALADNWRADR